MKRIASLLLALCCCASLFAARGRTTPKGWYDDFEFARKEAARLKRPILVLFTGSDWCGYCIKLRKGALDKNDFKTFAQKHLILVYADSPRKTRLPKELTAQNRELKKKLGAGGGVPCTIILSPDGRKLGRIGGCPQNPADYLKKVRAITKKQ